MERFAFLFLFYFFFAGIVSGQIPGSWKSRGIGGGGALYSPSVNPADHDEIYMACDMSEVFHTFDQGATWSEVNFLSLQGGHDACVQFTIDPNIRYAVDYTPEGGSDGLRPVKSTDSGATWRQQYLDPSGANAMNALTPQGKKYRTAGMENTSCWQILWTDSLHLYAAYSDINGIKQQPSGPGSYQITVAQRKNRHPNPGDPASARDLVIFRQSGCGSCFSRKIHQALKKLPDCF